MMLMQGTHEPVTAMRVTHERQPSPYRLAHVDKKTSNR